MRPTALAALSLSITLLIAPIVTQASSSNATLSQDDAAWLRRDAFGLDTATVAQYRALGRKTMLEKQLDDRLGDSLPAPITAQLASYESFYTPLDQLLTSIQDEQQQIKAMPDGPNKVAANQGVASTWQQTWTGSAASGVVARHLWP
jgi:hypothetical protein